MDAAYPDLLRAIAFAARAHRHQLRKDGETPYVSHVFRVCLTVRQLFGIDDVAVLMAAVLHDTVEDTNTDYDDIAEQFGGQVAGWVANLTKNKALPEAEREEDYCRRLAAAPWQVKAGKLADIYDNLQDSRLGAKSPLKTIPRSRQYLEALDAPDLPPAVRRAWEAVRRLLEEREKEVPAAT